MAPRLTYTDSSGDTRLKTWAIPLVVAAICVPVVLAMLIGILTIEGTGLGLAAGAAAVAILLILALRMRPQGSMEVAAHTDEGRRVLVVVLGGPEVSHEPEAQEIVRLADCTIRGEGERLLPEVCRTVLEAAL